MRRRTAAELIDVCGAVPGTSRSITTHALSSFLRALPALIRTDKHSESLNQLASSLVQVLQILLEHASSSGPASSGNTAARSMFEDDDTDSSSFFVARKESQPAAARFA
jgi:type II secretory pathway component PulJ